MRPHVLELLILTRYEYAALHEGDKRRMARAVQRLTFPVNHTTHSVSLLVVTRETPSELLERIGPRLETISAIEDWRCVSLGELVAAKNGGNDPLVHRLPLAWHEARRLGQRTKAEDLRHVRAGDVFAKHGIDVDRQAAVKMGLRGLWQRKTPADPNDPKS